MDNTELREELAMMVQQIPDEGLEEARRLLRDLLESRGEHDPELISVEPFDRSRARPEFLERLDAAKEAARRGEVVSDEEFSGETLIEPLEDESMLRPEFVAELKESEEAARRGDVVTLEEFLRGAAR